MQYLNVWDVVAIVLYFVLVIGVGFYAMYQSQRSTVSGYFLAGRFMTWLPVGASIFASNIGSDHFIGLAGSGASSGISVGAFEFNALFILQVLGWIFLPVYIASKVCTLPEYMTKRFGGKRIRIFLAILSLVLYIFTKLSVNLFSGAIFIKETLGWNLYLSTFLLLAMTCLCTVTGGLAAVIYTDTLQFFIMIIGASILMTKSFMAVGGIAGLKAKYQFAVPSEVIPNSTCGIPGDDAWTMLRNPYDSTMPWPGFLLGQTPASIWYWCADQMMVQRTLAAKSLSHAQGGTLFAGYMKLLPMFLIVMPGMVSRVLYPDVVGCVKPEVCEKHCGSRLGCSNLAYPKLVLELMPAGLRGVMFAVMLAALMSDLTSVFNSASTLFTMDMWRFIRPRALNSELLLVGKSFVVFMVAVSIAWIPVILQMQGGQLFIYIQAISAYLSPPIAAVYLVSVFIKRLNEIGAFWSLIIGFIIGLVRMGLDFYYTEPACGEVDTRPPIIAQLHYMYFAAILFWLTIFIAIGLSYVTPPPAPSQLIRTTYWTRFDSDKRDDEVDQMELSTASTVAIEQITKLPTETQNGDVSENLADNTCPEESTSRSPLPTWKKAYYWFCGYDYDGHAAENYAMMQEHLEKLSTLSQDRVAKLVLNINLAIILIVGTLVFIFFSVVISRL